MFNHRRNITFRYTCIVFMMILFCLAIICRAAFIMFFERQYWKDVADRYVREGVIVPPTRGNIISSDGKLMASSLPEYKIFMDFKAGGHIKDSILMAELNTITAGLHQIFPRMSTREFKNRILKGRKMKSRSYPIYPHRISYIELKEVKKLPVFKMNRYKGGFYELAYNQRKKPFGSLAMRTLGDLYPDREKGAKNGLELTYDSILKGKPGITHRKKVRNKYLNITDQPPVDGCDLITTIDVDMQDIAEKALVDQLENLSGIFGVAIVMDVKTGNIKANVNMTRAGDGRYYEMRNAAVSNLMEPGSTFKTASILLALNDGYITPDYRVDTKNGDVMMHGSHMKDWNWGKGGFGEIDVTRIMEVSSNVGVSHIIDKYYGDNPQRFIDGLRRMSIDTPLNLGIVGEATPKILGPKERYFSKTTLPWMSIGYETQIPPIYLLNFYNAIANDGCMVRPKFVEAITKDGEIVKKFDTEIINPKICSDKALKDIQYILKRVVSHGLAKDAGSKQFSVSGKTGTAQVSQGKSGYKNNGVSYLVSFCGYFPSDNPKYSCLVSIHIPHGPASGGRQAGSVFSKIAERVYAKHLYRDIKEAKDSLSVMIPDIKNGNIKEAAYVLKKLKIDSNASHIGTDGKPVWGKSVNTIHHAQLEEMTVAEKLVPNVRGMGAKDAVYILESRGLNVTLTGTGKVVWQSIRPGSHLYNNQTISLRLDNRQ